MPVKPRLAAVTACVVLAALTSACAFLQTPVSQPAQTTRARSSGVPASNAEYVDPVQLFADPEPFIGKTVVLQGEALNVYHNDELFAGEAIMPSYTWARLEARQRGSNETRSVVVEVYPRQDAIKAKQCYRFVGTVLGTQDGPASLPDVPRTMPLVKAQSWEAIQPDQGKCPAPR